VNQIWGTGGEETKDGLNMSLIATDIKGKKLSKKKAQHRRQKSQNSLQ